MPRHRPELPALTAADVVSRLGRALSPGRARRSALFLWLLDNHDELAAAFARSSPSWSALAAILAEGGVVDGHGKAPTGRGARNAWFRVRQAKAGRVPRSAPAVDPGHIAPGVRAAPPAGMPEEAPRFRLASLKDASPPIEPRPVPPVAPSAAPAPPVQDPEAVVARLLGKPAMPTPKGKP